MGYSWQICSQNMETIGKWLAEMMTRVATLNTMMMPVRMYVFAENEDELALVRRTKPEISLERLGFLQETFTKWAEMDAR